MVAEPGRAAGKERLGYVLIDRSKCFMHKPCNKTLLLARRAVPEARAPPAAAPMSLCPRFADIALSLEPNALRSGA